MIMSSSVIRMDLLLSNIDFEIEKLNEPPLLSGISIPDAKNAVTVIYKLRRYGISLLLGMVDVPGFFRRLGESASLKFKKLEKLSDNPEFSRFCLGSDYLPCLGAFLSGDSDLAKKIAELSSDNWNEDYEYEEDFLYGQFFYQYFKNDCVLGDFIQPILKSLEEADDADAPQYALMDALATNDEDGFKGALDVLLEEHEALCDKLDGSLTVDKEKFSTEMAVHIEAMAWIKIAGLAGIKVDADYKYIPSILLPDLC